MPPCVRLMTMLTGCQSVSEKPIVPTKFPSEGVVKFGFAADSAYTWMSGCAKVSKVLKSKFSTYSEKVVSNTKSRYR